MSVHYPNVSVNLKHVAQNEFAVMHTVCRAMREKGISPIEILDFQLDAMKGDFEHLLKTVGEYVVVSKT